MNSPRLDARTLDFIESLLASPGSDYGSPEGLLGALADQAANQGWPFDWRAGVTFWWDLCRVGAVAIVGGGAGGVTSGRPRYIVTERGRRLFARKDESPHRVDRYLDGVRRRVATPDPIAIAYLEEAVEAWKSDLNRASAVMLGCACERLIVMLAEAVRDADLPAFSDKLRKVLAADRPTGISVVFELVRDALNGAAEDRALPGELADAIDRKLTPIFEHARGLRNRHGHPTGDAVPAEDAEAGLLLFPGFYELVEKLRVHLSGPDVGPPAASRVGGRP